MPEHVACIGEEQRKYRTEMAFLRGKCRIFIPLTIEVYVLKIHRRLRGLSQINY